MLDVDKYKFLPGVCYCFTSLLFSSPTMLLDRALGAGVQQWSIDCGCHGATVHDVGFVRGPGVSDT